MVRLHMIILSPIIISHFFSRPPPHRSPSEEPAADRILDEQLIPMLGSVMVLICSGGMPCPGRLTGQSLTNGHVK